MYEGDNLGMGANGDTIGPIISSDPSEQQGAEPSISTAGASNSSKFFGGRSRFKPAGTQARTDVENYAAAQNIASNPNTPQFFSDAVIANTPYPTEAPSTNKKPLIFAGVAVLVLVLVVVGVVALVGSGSKKPGEGEIPIAQVDEYITREEALAAMDFENDLRGIIEERSSDTDAMFDKEFHDTLFKNFESYKKIASNIANYKTVQGEDVDGRNVKVEAVATKMAAVLPSYEKLMDNYGKIYDAFKDKSKLDNISDTDLKNRVSKIVKTKADYDAQEKLVKQYGCSGEGANLPAGCKAMNDAYYDLEDELAELMEHPKNLLLGENADTSVYRNNYISSELADVVAYIGEQKLKEAEK